MSVYGLVYRWAIEAHLEPVWLCGDERRFVRLVLEELDALPLRLLFEA